MKENNIGKNILQSAVIGYNQVVRIKDAHIRQRNWLVFGVHDKTREILFADNHYFRDMKRAIVVGASSGIGREVAKLLIADGWNVGVAARRAEKLYELKDLAPSSVLVIPIDVTSNDAPRLLMELIRQLGGVDLFFYASGIGKQNVMLETDIEMRTVSTNAMGFTRMVGAMYNYMAGHGGGHIAVISSIAGTKGLGAAPSYSATKAFQNTYIQALEQQANMRGLNIRFTDIRPGFVDTPLLSGEGHYPMLMDVKDVARDIMRSLERQRHVRVIDRRYRLLVALWRLVPGWMWRRMRFSQRFFRGKR